MAAAPLESSSTPPDAIPIDSTRSSGDPMEDIDPQSTRKRPRLDSGSGIREPWSTDEAPAAEMSEQTPDAPAMADEEPQAPPSSRPASRVTINMKSPTIDPTATGPEETPDPAAGSPEESGAHPSNAISVSSSRTQSPEIEVAELEDMDQDPGTSSWRSLGEALRDPDVVQLHEERLLIDLFPRLRPEVVIPDCVEEIAAILEKGPPHDPEIFLAVKSWLDEVTERLDQLSYQAILQDKEFWDEVHLLAENLLRRTQGFRLGADQDLWTFVAEYLLSHAQITLHMMCLDVIVLKQLVDDPDLAVPDLLSRAYLPSLGWMVQTSNIPFFRALELLHGSEVRQLVAHLGAQLVAPPFNVISRLTDLTTYVLALVQRDSQMPAALVSILMAVNALVESCHERKRFEADDTLPDSPGQASFEKAAYALVRAIDSKYQADICKKLPWVSSDVSESMIRYISQIYCGLCRCDPTFVPQIANDLSIELPEGLPHENCSTIIYYGWKFSTFKKHIMDGRMELRVHGIESMQADLVTVWRTHIQTTAAGIEHPLVQYLLNFLRDNNILQYIVGVDSHPQLISRSGNIPGFLVVTSTYTDEDTDIIWKTVTESPDPRMVSEILGMLTRTFSMHLSTSPALLYLCSKVLELPLIRFDSRMIEFCEQLLHHIREKHDEKQQVIDEPHVDAIPLRLCVRLIRDGAVADDISVDHKALLQKFAGSQLSSFMNVGLSESDKMETYERCVQDIAEKNQFASGSIQALNALLPGHDTQEIQRLATDFDLVRLVITEMAHTVEMNNTDFTDSFSKNGFLSRVHLIARIIDKVPEHITDDLGDILWWNILLSKVLARPGKRALWDMLCGIASHGMKRNPFVERCIQVYLPKTSPAEDYSEVFAFAKQTISYEVRFDPPPVADENEVIEIPGMDRIWNFILTAIPGSIEMDAINFAIKVYLDHGIIRRSPRSAIEATHIALVDRCVDQLKSVASQLKPHVDSMDEGSFKDSSQHASEGEEVRFSRSLLFLRQFLQGLRSRPQYSPPQGPPPGLPGKGELLDMHYQAFDGNTQSKVRSLRIGDLSTASELVERLSEATGFSKFNVIYSGRRINLLEKPEITLRDLKLTSGLLLIQKDPDSRHSALTGRRQSLTSVDSEVLKHFDDLYELLCLNDRLAREIYDFLVVFPPQERVLQLVTSQDKTENDMFPVDQPFCFLYSVNALATCLREESLEASPNQSFVAHSIRVLVAALTRPSMSEFLGDSPTKILIATSLVECLLSSFQVKPPIVDGNPLVPDYSALVQQLVRLMEFARHLPNTNTPESSIYKLICHSFAILIEGSIRDPDFWAVVKQSIQFDQFLFSLLLDEPRQPIRKGISENISIACSPSALFKKAGKTLQQEGQGLSQVGSKDSVRIDILAVIWDAFLQNFPRTVSYVQQSHEFFEISHVVFHSVVEKSPSDHTLSEYLKQWSSIMLSHRTEEFVGREPRDPVIFGFCRLLRSCLELAIKADVNLDTFDITERLFDNYLFPDFSEHSTSLIKPQIPIMHTQTRQELYTIISLLSNYGQNNQTIVRCLRDIIPRDETYSPSWAFDRHKMIRSPEGYAGLKNLSNTCYLNSLMTQLFMNVSFRDFLMQLNLTDPESSQKLLYETKKVFGYMQETWHKSVDPQDLVDSIRTYDNEPVDVTVQMDVDEFYNLLFDRWEAQILGAEDKKKFRSFYGGQLVQQIKSKECSHISERLEPFSAIQCDIKGKASLEESLQAYVEGEIMQGDNKYSCTSCERHVDAVKRACLKDVPDNLIFHLKRFDFDMVTMMRSKINDEFQFPEHIDMTPFKVDYLSDPDGDAKEDIFELVGVLVHTGTAESGHYYSYIRERPTAGNGGSWVEFNDSDVSRFDQTKIADQCFGGFNDSTAMQLRFNKVWNAYMLFYQRVSSMESEKALYKPTQNNIPVRVPLPVPLANHITLENEVFVRTYCLLDPYHALFVRFILARIETDCKSNNQDKDAIFITLDTVEQLVARTRETMHLDSIVAELLRTIKECPHTAYPVVQWVEERPAAIRNLILRSPHAAIRNSTIKIIMCALSKLRELRDSAEDGSWSEARWHSRYQDGLEELVTALDRLWPGLQTVSRSWDDYFEFVLVIASFGPQEAGVVLNYGFLLKCLEIIWLDREDTMRLRRHYLGYVRLVEKGRRFSHRKLTDLLSVLLGYIDLAAQPTPDDERDTLPDGKYALTATESTFVRPLGSDGELALLNKVLQQYTSPQACSRLVGLFLDAEPDAGLMDPICRVLEEGLRVAPAELCFPFLEATIIFCRRSPDKDRIVALIDHVAKGVNTIHESGGKEHLAFFTELLSCRNNRLHLDETWFTTRLVDRIPDWAPSLLLFPDSSVRRMTTDLLQGILFTGESGEMGDDWQQRHSHVAKELVRSSIDRLNAFLSPENNVESRAIDTIKFVINHCLTTYYDDSEEDQDYVRQANAVLEAIDEVVVDVPEELASEEWEDNSIASGSEVGMTGSP